MAEAEEVISNIQRNDLFYISSAPENGLSLLQSVRHTGSNRRALCNGQHGGGVRCNESVARVGRA
jgi:hypothetical protein